MDQKDVVISDYVVYRAHTREFAVETRRLVAVGHSGNRLVMIPYEENGKELIPVTIHAVTRQQIRFRVNTGRFIYG